MKQAGAKTGAVTETPTTMKRTTRVLAGAAVLSAAIVASTFSLAQQTPPPSAPPSADAMREHWQAHMRERAEARAKALHDVLRIRPDQEGAFQAFLGAMRPAEHRMGPAGEHPDHQAMAALTTPQRLDRMAERMAKHQADFQRKADAVRRFYSVLNPDQQRAFDALHEMMGGEHRGKHGEPGGEHRQG